MFNSNQLGYKDNPPLRCSECGKKSDQVKRIIHLPLSNGRAGWISLTKWTNFCPSCILDQSKKIDDLVSKAFVKEESK